MGSRVGFMVWGLGFRVQGRGPLKGCFIRDPLGASLGGLDSVKGPRLKGLNKGS